MGIVIVDNQLWFGRDIVSLPSMRQGVPIMPDGVDTRQFGF